MKNRGVGGILEIGRTGRVEALLVNMENPGKGADTKSDF